MSVTPPLEPGPDGSQLEQGTSAVGAPAQWAWAQQAVRAPQTRWVETPPLAYHQLLRGVPRYRWWKPLVALVLGVLYYLTLSTVYTLLIVVPYLFTLDGNLSENALAEAILSLALPDTQKPVSLLLTLGSIALMLPSAWLAMLSAGLRPASRLWSAALRIRWRVMARTIMPAVVALVVMNAVAMLWVIVVTPAVLDADVAGEPVSTPTDFDPSVIGWSAVLIVLLVPLQATAEEVVFRGAFMQILGAWLGGFRAENRFGRWLRGPWIVVIIPSLAFGFAHIYDVWGWLSVVAMAVCAGWLSWRTGGLEAAIMIHVVNNLVAFGFMLFAFGGETGQTADGGGPGAAVGAVIGLGLYAWWVSRRFARSGEPWTRVDLVEERIRR